MTDSPQKIDATYLAILDSVDAVIYIADMSNYELLFLNRKARETSHAQVGTICWQTLQQGQKGPCPFCTNDKLLDDLGKPNPPHIWQVNNTLNGECWECRDQAIQWSDGRLVRLEIATNITAREREEQELRIKEERLDLALNSAEMGTWDWNPQTGATIYSERWAKMLGYDLKHLTLHVDTWANLIHPDDKEQTMASLKAHLADKTPIYQAEFRARTHSGEWRWMLDLGKVITRDSQGRPLRVTGTQQDITERKKRRKHYAPVKKICKSRSILYVMPLFQPIFDKNCTNESCGGKSDWMGQKQSCWKNTEQGRSNHRFQDRKTCRRPGENGYRSR